MIKILAMIISWSIKNLRKILKIFTGKHVKIGIFLKSLFLGISLIKKFKTFTIVRLIIQGLALANLLFSIFIIISFSDIDFSSINIPPLTQLISIIFGILPFFFTDSAYYIYYLNNIIENITYNTVASDIIDNLNNDNIEEIHYDYGQNIDNAPIEEEEFINNWNTKSILIISVSVIGLGLIYYYHPEYYTITYDYITNCYNITYNYITNFFNIGRGGEDPDNNGIANTSNVMDYKGKGRADVSVTKFMEETSNEINDTLNNTIEASNELFLNNKFRNTNSVPPYLLDNIKKTIDRNNFIIENYRKIPRIFYTNNDNKNYEILLDLNTHLEKELERFNSSTSTSASFSINKDISNIDLTPKVSNIDLTPRAPNIEPKFLNPDYFATPKVSNLTEYPPIPKTNEGFPEMESVTNKVVTLPEATPLPENTPLPISRENSVSPVRLSEDQPVSLPKKE